MAVLGLVLYLGLVPMQRPEVIPTVYNTVYNDSTRVLKTLSITVGKRTYDIGPLPPGSSLPFHFSPDDATSYSVSGSYGPGSQVTQDVPIGTPPYPKAILRIKNETIRLKWVKPKHTTPPN